MHAANPPVCRKEPEGDSLGLLTFTFRELKEATRNFGASNLVGEGGFGEVFRGRVILSAAYVSSRASVDDSHRGEPDAPHLDKTQSSREVQVAVKRLREANDDGVEQFLVSQPERTPARRPGPAHHFLISHHHYH